ncbi:unnamed protein product [Withania somnifera]
MAIEDDTIILYIDSLNSTATSSSTSLDLDRTFESSSSPLQPLSPSLNKLNVRAAAFIPSSSSSPSLSSTMLSKSSSSPSLASMSTSQAENSARPWNGNRVGPGHGHGSRPVNGQMVVHVIATPSATFHQISGHVPVQNYIYASQLPMQHRYGGGIGRGFVDHGGVPAVVVIGADAEGLSDEACQKIVNQVEFYFSDINLATTDHLLRIMFKDPEGFVPMSVVASFKKIKALTTSHAQVAKILRSSTKLVVSEDGRKVRRQFPLSEKDLEEVQSRIVVAENLPEDHCHQNLMKIFSAVGSVKMIRTCQPQLNSGASSSSRAGKSDSTLYSNKLHAFVEYETVELAEKAVMELNDEDNWRNGLKLRILDRRTGKSGQIRVKKVGYESEVNFKEEDTPGSDVSEKYSDNLWHHFDTHLNDLAWQEEHGVDGQRKGLNHSWVKGPGQGRGRPQFHQNNRGGHLGTPPALSSINRFSLAGQSSMLSDHSASGKQASVPRMPDGTRGFSMGRGKPVAIKTA